MAANLRIFSHSSKEFEEFEEELVATPQNATHSKEFEKFEDARTIAANLRISLKTIANPKVGRHGSSIFGFFEIFGMYRVFARRDPFIFEFFELCENIRRLAGMVLPSSNFSNSLECIAFCGVASRPSSNSSNHANIFEDWLPWFLHLRIFRILWNVSRFVASRSVPLRILRIVQDIRRLAAMVVPSSDFSNSLECIAFSRVATHSSSNSSNYDVIFEDWPTWFFHLRIFRILWNVSRFRASQPVHLRILRIMPISSKIGCHGSSIFDFFSNSLECIAFCRVAKRPFSNSSNCARYSKIGGHGSSIFGFFEFFGMCRVFARRDPFIFEFFGLCEQFEDCLAWFFHLRIFRILWNVSRLRVLRHSQLRILRIVREYSKIGGHGSTIFEFFEFFGKYRVL